MTENCHSPQIVLPSNSCLPRPTAGDLVSLLSPARRPRGLARFRGQLRTLRAGHPLEGALGIHTKRRKRNLAKGDPAKASATQLSRPELGCQSSVPGTLQGAGIPEKSSLLKQVPQRSWQRVWRDMAGPTSPRRATHRFPLKLRERLLQSRREGS